MKRLVIFIAAVLFASAVFAQESVAVPEKSEEAPRPERPRWEPKTALQHYFGDVMKENMQNREKRPPRRNYEKNSAEEFAAQRKGPDWIYTGLDDETRMTAVGHGINWEQASLEAFYNLAMIAGYTLNGDNSRIKMIFEDIQRLGIYYMQETKTCYVIYGVKFDDCIKGKLSSELPESEKRRISVVASEVEKQTDVEGKAVLTSTRKLKLYYKEWVEDYECVLSTDGKTETEAVLIDGEEPVQFTPPPRRRRENAGETNHETPQDKPVETNN